MPETTLRPMPGFQGSETSRAEVTIYQHSGDPVVLVPSGRGSFPMSGRKSQDMFPSLLSVTTDKSLGAASGSFSIVVKPSKAGWSDSLFQELVDDDWVDIVFYRHDQPWHVMRGLIDDIRRSVVVTGRGATVEVFHITGRDFGKIWEMTPVWFSPYANSDMITSAIARKVFNDIPMLQGSPDKAVMAYMKGFLEALGDNAGVNWTLPPGMPSAAEGLGPSREGGWRGFIENVAFANMYYQDVPKRKMFNADALNPQGRLWELAKNASDPLFTELYVDLLPDADPFSPRLAAGDPLTPEEMYMTVVIRDKPFPTTADVEGFVPWWDRVPVFTVPRQQIGPSDVGRSGAERFNTFYLAGLMHTEDAEAKLRTLVPLVDLEEIKRHGMRRMDVQSQMVPSEESLNLMALADTQRRIARDWYCLNPYYLSGTLNLMVGRPDIKIGCRVRVPGMASEDEDESYYMEQIIHNWTFGSSTKTTLGVTRGWIGTDDSHLDRLAAVVAPYTLPAMIRDT